MVDDLQDLGAEERFIISPNWRDNNAVELLLNREIVAFSTTITDIFNYSELNQNKITLKFTNETKEQEHDIIDFFHDKIGRLKRFWLQGHKEEFVLSRDITVTDTIIYIEDNGFDFVYQGHERIYLALTNRDLITRKITNVSKSGTELLLTVSAMDRNIAKEDVGIFGRIFLVRFNKDVLEIIHLTNVVSECVLEFVEVLKEYDL